MQPSWPTAVARRLHATVGGTATAVCNRRSPRRLPNRRDPRRLGLKPPWAMRPPWATANGCQNCKIFETVVYFCKMIIYIYIYKISTISWRPLPVRHGPKWIGPAFSSAGPRAHSFFCYLAHYAGTGLLSACLGPKCLRVVPGLAWKWHRVGKIQKQIWIRIFADYV
jgi:hypothetical protein